jgi:aspartyl-tRNA(Asn)/glutamyl-tRNA(Gln) amidotransferase subunit A
VRLSDEQHPQLDEMAKVSAKAAITNIEAYAIHRELLAAHAADYDPFVRGRLEGGRDISAADYVALMRARAVLVREMDARLSDLDGLVLPTTPIVAPTIAEVSASFEAFMAKQLLGFRNTSIINFFDLCAVSLPLPREGQLPVGLMLVARNGQDRKLLRMAAAVEHLFSE